MEHSLYRQIAIEGNIGAGKTTITNRLGKALEAKVILERFENNPFLPQFYADKERYALQVELFFLADRYQQLSKELLGDIFQEYTVYDYHFAKSAIFSSLNLANHELDLFRNLYSVMERFIPKPDILIYIHHGLERLSNHIDQRGRGIEDNIPKPYLEQIHLNYMRHFKEQRHFPIIVLDFEYSQAHSADSVLVQVKSVLQNNWPNGMSILSC